MSRQSISNSSENGGNKKSLNRSNFNIILYLFSWLYSIVVVGIIFLCFFLVNNSLNPTDLPSTDPVYSPDIGFNTVRAQKHLTSIATTPHSFNNPNNEKVLKYLIDQVDLLKTKSDRISYIYDNKSQVAIPQYKKGITAFYFPVSNLVVRFKGNDSNGKGILISAHYDSSPLSPGATDAGVGVSVGLEILEALIQSPPNGHDVLVNFNNGEEHGLLGSMGYQFHPWYNDTELFINLEGSGAGGKALLFQSSNTALTKALVNGQSHHGNVVGNDLFQLGVLPSSTDYQIYTSTLKIPGVDIAMYRNRAFYHTAHDDLDHAPISTTHHMGTFVYQGIQNIATSAMSRTFQKPIYYDFLTWATVVFDFNTCYYLIGFLYLVEILLAIFYFFRYRNFKQVVNKKFILSTLIGTGFSILGLLITVLIGYILTLIIIKTNPMIVHSWPKSVFVLFIILAVWGQLFAHMIWILVDRSKSTPNDLQTASWFGTLLLYNILLIVELATHLIGLSSFFFISIQTWCLLIGFLVYVIFDTIVGLLHHRLPSKFHESSKSGVILQQIQPIFSFLISYFTSGITVFSIGLPLVFAVNQAVPSGGAPSLPYFVAMGITAIACWPLGPNLLATKHIKPLFAMFSIALLVTYIVVAVKFPYTNTSPLSIQFRQLVELDPSSLQIKSSTVSLDISRKSDLLVSHLPTQPKMIDRDVLKGSSTFDIVSYDTDYPKLPDFKEHVPKIINYAKGGANIYDVEFTFSAPSESKICFLNFTTPVEKLQIAQNTDEYLSLKSPLDGTTDFLTEVIRLFRNDPSRAWRLKLSYRQNTTVSVAFDFKAHCYLNDNTEVRKMLKTFPDWVTFGTNDLGLIKVITSYQLKPGNNT